MPLSRLRLRLAGAFAVAFVLGLGLLAAGALGYLWRESLQRLDRRLAAVADGVQRNLARELHETPDSSFAFAANEVVLEWPANEDAFGIADEHGRLVAGINRGHALDPVMGAWARSGFAEHFDVSGDEPDLHAVALSHVTFRDGAHDWRFGVVAFGSREAIESDTRLLAGALAIAAPLIALLSLAAGYVLARRALRPAAELGAAIAAIAPADLSHRLPVLEPRDEIAALAAEFNALLARLDEAQRRNRGFVREAAHQIRTPLTLVLGEAGHALAAADASADRLRETLGRIRAAAEQIRRRVDELFLLAEAQAGARVRLDDDVELDGLALECTDLMRSRASALGRTLAIGRAEHVVVRGNQALLKEALVELLENGCRHGSAQPAVTVAAFAEGAGATLEVTSGGAPFGLPARDVTGAPLGLGLPIVDWIARAHGGELRILRRGDLNVVSLVLPTALSRP